MALEIYDGATFLYALPRVMNASLTDKLSGERTLSFSTLISRSQGMRPGLVAKLDGQYYSVVRVSRKIADGFPMTAASPPGWWAATTSPISSMTKPIILSRLCLKGRPWRGFSVCLEIHRSASVSVKRQRR